MIAVCSIVLRVRFFHFGRDTPCRNDYYVYIYRRWLGKHVANVRNILAMCNLGLIDLYGVVVSAFATVLHVNIKGV